MRGALAIRSPLMLGVRRHLGWRQADSRRPDEGLLSRQASLMNAVIPWVVGLFTFVVAWAAIGQAVGMLVPDCPPEATVCEGMAGVFLTIFIGVPVAFAFGSAAGIYFRLRLAGRDLSDDAAAPVGGRKLS